jgi:hypothetical protein
MSYDNGLRLVLQDISEKTSKKDQRVILDYIDNQSSDSILEGHNFVIKMLPYYYGTHKWLGSLAHMATTHIQKPKHDGIYSVYFAVLGEDWYKKGDTSRGRVVHDEVIVKCGNST